MFEIGIVGPIVTLLAGVDITLHFFFDYRKIQNQSNRQFQDLEVTIPRLALFTAAGATILSFFIVFILCISWAANIAFSSLMFFGFIFDPPSLIWIIGLATLSSGIILHGWSRVIRHEEASNWQIAQSQKLFDSGPYSRIRHPSYLSYFLSFIGMAIMVPSVLTWITLFGIPGYYFVAQQEEKDLIVHFGEEYRNYMKHAGMFLPKWKTKDD